MRFPKPSLMTRVLGLGCAGLVAGLATGCSDDAADGTTTTVTGSTTATGATTSGGDGGGGGGDGGMGGSGGSVPEATLLLTQNPAGRDLDAVVVTDDAGNASITHTGLGVITSIESIAIASNGDGFVSYDAAFDSGGVMVVAGLANQTSGILGEGARRITGQATGLIAPKGLEIAESLGVVLVADTGASDIKAFALDAEGDVAPEFVISELGGQTAWDTAFDAQNDRLYVAATNGDVLVFDGISINQGVNGPTRSFSPADGGSKVSANLHGIKYVASLNPLLRPNQLVLSDVGDPASGTDGQLFTIADPATATGLEQVRARINGPASALGNPVDIVLDSNALGDDVYVAEKSNDKVFRFDDITAATGTADSAADAGMDLVKGESLALIGGLNGRILVAQNPDGRDGDGVARLLPALTVEATIGEIGDILSIQSTSITPDGDAWITYDRPGGQGGLMFVAELATLPDPLVIGGGTRRIQGPNTGLLAPKGAFASEDLGAVIVADPGAERVFAFALDADGDVAPIWVVGDLGGDRGVWDAAYDADTDRLFVAATDGVVLVYDAFSVNPGTVGPTRTITPAVAGEKASVNLHGIAYLAEEDLLVLSDVGDPASAADGQLFTIATAGEADGTVDVRWRLGGAATKLGNPVDLGVGLGDLYVVEKANDLLLVFEDVAGRTGDEDVAAAAEAVTTKPESIAIVVE
jgi:hypothetical protein